MTQKMNSAAWIVPLITLPIIIDEPGLYVTRSGEFVQITEASTVNTLSGCTGYYLNGEIPEHWHRSGRIYHSMQSQNDVVRKYKE